MRAEEGEQGDAPHPLPNGQVLQREVLRPLEPEEEEVEDRAQPVELRLVDVVLGAVSSGVARRTSHVARRERRGGRGEIGFRVASGVSEIRAKGAAERTRTRTHRRPRTADCPSVVLSANCILQMQIEFNRVVSVRHVDRAAPGHKAERGTNM